MVNKVKVLVVDDSAIVRQVLSQGLSQDAEIEVIGTASDPYQARDKILYLKPNVLTLDVEMPRMDGVAFLRRLMPQYPLPVLMVSSLTERGKKITMEALEAGAIDFVTKPTTNVSHGLNDMLSELSHKVKIAARANVTRWRDPNYRSQKAVRQVRALAESTDKVIAIGASTGGTEAISYILSSLPGDMPGIVVVQHMPPGFTKMFAQRLNEQSAMHVKEAVSGDRVLRGRVLIAPGGHHVEVVRSGGMYHVKCREGEKVCGHRPSVEVMMNSVAQAAGSNALGVILTGMGADGAGGLLAMRQAGAKTMAQDEASCVVFGMPKVAYERGGTDKLVSLDHIPEQLIAMLVTKG